MKTTIFILLVSVFTFVSCNTKDTLSLPTQETPEALEDKKAVTDFSLKRGQNNLIENLYSELVSKNIDLQQLEDKIEDLNNSKNDTIRLFDKFNQKNQMYFNSAQSHILDIKDALLRNKMRDLIAQNNKKYNMAISKHKKLLDVIVAKDLTISDLHNVLKIVKTLPLIEKYQNDKLPNVKTLEGYINHQNSVILLTDSLIIR